MENIQMWWNHNWVYLLLLPGNILTIEAVIRQAAVNHGYKNAVNLCDKIANFVGFIADIIAGLLIKKQEIKK